MTDLLPVLCSPGTATCEPAGGAREAGAGSTREVALPPGMKRSRPGVGEELLLTGGKLRVGGWGGNGGKNSRY